MTREEKAQAINKEFNIKTDITEQAFLLMEQGLTAEQALEKAFENQFKFYDNFFNDEQFQKQTIETVKKLI